MRMPVYDKIVLAREARELSFNRDAYEKMSRLAGILRFLNAEQELSPLLALKGGTAINLAVFDLPRLSVDIDMDFADNLSKEDTGERRERINELLGRYMAAEGYALRDKSKRSHALDSFVFSYTNAAGNLDNIKVEINYMLRCHALPSIKVTTRATGVFTPFSIRMLAPVEIFASKIVALSSRAAARDLYDLNNLLAANLFSEPDITLLRKCAVLYLAITGTGTARGFSVEKIHAMTQRTVKTDLFPMIRNAERFDFQAAKERVTTFLSETMLPTERESEFLRRFSKGHYEPQLLFDDEDILQRIEKHPMAAWRIQKIKNERHER